MSGRNPKITFIIPSYWQGRFIGTALGSIANQDLPADSFEVLVFDGGSNDGTKEVIARNPVVSYWESAPDKGQAAAVNKGLLRARGEIVAWLNSDDLYLPGALAAALAFLDSHPHVDAVYGQTQDIGEMGNSLRMFPVSDWSEQALLDSCIISQPSCFFRRSFAERNGKLREDLHLTLDYEYWLRARKWARFHHLPQLWACNRIHDKAKSSIRQMDQLRESAKVVYEASGEWREAWLRRIASAQGRQWLKAFGMSKSVFRPWLSAFAYHRLRRKIARGESPV